MRWNLMKEMWRKFRSGGAVADVALLKIVALEQRPKSREVLDHLEQVRGYIPEADMPALRKLPDGTFGREYARFLDAQNIDPFVFSDELKERFSDETFAFRFLTTHDHHHVLAGFDAGAAGEAGVLAFNVAQGTFGSKGMLWLAKLLYPLFTPSNVFRLWRNVRVGYAMGKQAKLLLAQRMEDQYERPLAEVRAAYGIPEPASAGVVPSNSSWMINLVYGSRKTPKLAPAS